VDFISSADVVNQFDGEKWNQQDSQDGDFVGGRHGVQNLTRISRIGTNEFWTIGN